MKNRASLFALHFKRTCTGAQVVQCALKAQWSLVCLLRGMVGPKIAVQLPQAQPRTFEFGPETLNSLAYAKEKNLKQNTLYCCAILSPTRFPFWLYQESKLTNWTALFFNQPCSQRFNLRLRNACSSRIFSLQISDLYFGLTGRVEMCQSYNLLLVLCFGFGCRLLHLQTKLIHARLKQCSSFLMLEPTSQQSAYIQKSCNFFVSNHIGSCL